MPERCRPLRALALLLALAPLAAGCEPGGERVRVTAGAFAIEPRGPEDPPVVGAWGEELRPGRKLIAVSADLVERGMGPGARAHIEGLPAKYVVADQVEGSGRIEIFMGTDAAAVERWGEREVDIYWVEP